MDSVERRTKWLEENGFDAEGYTYVYFPSDSYQVKETLKNCGFRFNKFLLWHCATIPEGYEPYIVAIHLDEVCEIGAWGTGNYLANARETVELLIKAARPPMTSAPVGREGERLKDIPVTLSLVRNYLGAFGYSQIVKFETMEGNILKWFTSKEIPFEVGDTLLLTATVKEHTEDKYEDGAMVTIVTRGKLKAV